LLEEAADADSNEEPQVSETGDLPVRDVAEDLSEESIEENEIETSGEDSDKKVEDSSIEDKNNSSDKSDKDPESTDQSTSD
jgi:hypothetical protein